MPLYEYKCHSCGKIIEVIQKFSDDPLKTHDECGGELEKLISRSAFQLKGSGWYVTDYARSNGGAKSDEPKASNGKPDAAKTGSGPGETKSGDSKATESKATEAKPAAAPSTSETKS
jgi:putative FmdB family regulatory protein